jgi:hypothetical protein
MSRFGSSYLLLIAFGIGLRLTMVVVQIPEMIPKSQNASFNLKDAKTAILKLHSTLEFPKGIELHKGKNASFKAILQGSQTQRVYFESFGAGPDNNSPNVYLDFDDGDWRLGRDKHTNFILYGKPVFDAHAEVFLPQNIPLTIVAKGSDNMFDKRNDPFTADLRGLNVSAFSFNHDENYEGSNLTYIASDTGFSGITTLNVSGKEANIEILKGTRARITIKMNETNVKLKIHGGVNHFIFVSLDYKGEVKYTDNARLKASSEFAKPNLNYFDWQNLIKNDSEINAAAAKFGGKSRLNEAVVIRVYLGLKGTLQISEVKP